MKRFLAALTLITLAACGVDGPPERPAATGVALHGDAQIGIVGHDL